MSIQLNDNRISRLKGPIVLNTESLLHERNTRIVGHVSHLVYVKDGFHLNNTGTVS